MPKRNHAVLGSNYRYGMNGQEKENEILAYEGMSSAEYWMYDARLGRRWEVDPITYPWQSPYAAFNNNPIKYNDVKGLEGKTKGEPKKKKEEASSTDPVKKPGENWLDEVKVKPTFWEKFKDFFKKIGNSIKAFFKNLDKSIDKVGGWMRSTKLGRKLYNFDVNQRLEHPNNDWRKDGRHSNQEGDGAPSPQNSPLEKSDIRDGKTWNTGNYEGWDPDDAQNNEKTTVTTKPDSTTIQRQVNGRLETIKVSGDHEKQTDVDGIIQSGPNKGKKIKVFSAPK